MSRELAAFERVARENLLCGPETWTVRKIQPGRWGVFLPGAILPLFWQRTRREAQEALTDSMWVSMWNKSRSWYMGERCDDTNFRPLTDEEKAIVAAILAEKE